MVNVVDFGTWVNWVHAFWQANGQSDDDLAVAQALLVVGLFVFGLTLATGCGAAIGFKAYRNAKLAWDAVQRAFIVTMSEEYPVVVDSSDTCRFVFM